VAFGVDALGFRGGAKEARDIGESILLGALGECAVLLICLALAGEGFFQIVGSGHLGILLQLNRA
jgi:hypothetical protein